MGNPRSANYPAICCRLGRRARSQIDIQEQGGLLEMPRIALKRIKSRSASSSQRKVGARGKAMRNEGEREKESEQASDSRYSANEIWADSPSVSPLDRSREFWSDFTAGTNHFTAKRFTDLSFNFAEMASRCRSDIHREIAHVCKILNTDAPSVSRIVRVCNKGPLL